VTVPARDDPSVEARARTLLRRYGVVFRRVLERENAPGWRDLVLVYRRLEARGEIRGGRFVAGFAGEQFALPEAVGLLRAVRREPRRERTFTISAADPLNLTGIISPDARIPALAGNRVMYRDGVPIAALEAGSIRWIVRVADEQRRDLERDLVRRIIPPMLRTYLRANRNTVRRPARTDATVIA
jgi:ATP-dependent Lhr-like helicase